MRADIEAGGTGFGVFGIWGGGGSGVVFAALEFGFGAGGAFLFEFLFAGFGFCGVFGAIPGFAEGGVICGGFGGG